jgi:hypothetical protein
MKPVGDPRAEQPDAPKLPFGSSRLFGLFCLGFGVLVLAGNAAGLLLAGRYVPGLCILAPPIALMGLALTALPEQVGRPGPKSALAEAAVMVALAAGFALGVLLAFYPYSALRWLRLM